MAVVQVSQIQVRRGFLTNLGQLASAEFGWALDELRLFIGNGSIAEGAPYEGNTEILTQHSDIMAFIETYIFKGRLSGYTAQTGVTLSTPVKRTLQDKLDDIVNIKDFGAVGDGITNDLSAIQRAIDQIYNRLGAVVSPRTRRIINFYPGEYIIYGELRLPPNCVLRGTGRDSVRIIQGSPLSACVFKTTNSMGDADALLVNGQTPGPVELSNLTFVNSFGNAVGILESVNDVVIDRCRFIGNISVKANNDSSTCLTINSSYLKSNNINIVDSDFTGRSVGIKVTEGQGVTNVRIDKCGFQNLYRGLTVTAGNLQANASGIRVTSCVFDRISLEGITTNANVKGVITSLNTFLNVGRDQLSPSSAVISSVIDFGGDLCYSFADVFARTEDEDAVATTVKHNSTYVFSTDSTSHIKLGNTYQTIGKSILINNNTVNYIPLSPKFRQGHVTYSVQRNQIYRAGKIDWAADPNLVYPVTWRDSYTEVADTGIVANVVYNTVSGIKRPYVVFQADNRGTPSIITYDVKSNFNPLAINAVVQSSTLVTTSTTVAPITLNLVPSNKTVNIAFSTSSLSTANSFSVFAIGGTPMAQYPVTITSVAPPGSTISVNPSSFFISSGPEREVLVSYGVSSPAADTTSSSFMYTITVSSGASSAVYTLTQNRIKPDFTPMVTPSTASVGVPMNFTFTGGPTAAVNGGTPVAIQYRKQANVNDFYIPGYVANTWVDGAGTPGLYSTLNLDSSGGFTAGPYIFGMAGIAIYEFTLPNNVNWTYSAGNVVTLTLTVS